MNMKEKRHKMVPASYLLLMKNKKAFLIRRYNTGYQDGFYGFCAGHVERGETFRETIIREAKEEIGIDLKIDDLEVVYTMQRNSLPNSEELRHRIDIFFQAKNWKGEPRNAEPDKCDDAGWFSLDSLPEKTIPFVRNVLSGIRKGEFYSEDGF